MSVELMVNLRRAGFPVPLGIFPFETIVYFHIKGTAMITELILNRAMEACYLPAGWGQLGDAPLHSQNPTLYQGTQVGKYLLHT